MEGLRFTAQVAISNLAQGLFRRRRAAAAAATRGGVDGLAVGFMAGLQRSCGDGPLWIRVAKDEALLLLGRDAIRHGLEGSPDPFAADPEPKRARGDRPYLQACLQEAMRLWPTTPMLSRESVRDADWDGVRVKAGTQLLIVNTFNHRDRGEVAFADELAPEQWLSGEAAGDWQFNHFSHGPQGCPGTALALQVGTEMLGVLLREHELRLFEPALDPARRLPHMLDYFSLRFTLTPAVR